MAHEAISECMCRLLRFDTYKLNCIERLIFYGIISTLRDELYIYMLLIVTLRVFHKYCMYCQYRGILETQNSFLCIRKKHF